ncbi:MAG: hypothetical protein LBC77_03085, partial [Spirochaetaceae bacterium]|nr:hypothetical protein [Spirochaetaceae bacterium]
LTLSDLSWNANVSALTSRLTDAEVSAPFEAEDWSAAGGAALSAEASSGPIARILKIQLARTGGTAITGKLTLTDDDLDTMIRACVSGFYPCDTIEAGEIEELDVSL